jgi:hypothetical protein
MYFFKRFFCSVIATLVFSHCLLAEDTKTLQPTMKTIDRDWAYFESIPCKDIEKVAYHSPFEEKLLAKRKEQCMERYKAFYSRPTVK